MVRSVLIPTGSEYLGEGQTRVTIRRATPEEEARFDRAQVIADHARDLISALWDTDPDPLVVRACLAKITRGVDALFPGGK